MFFAKVAKQESCECCCKFLVYAAAKLRIRKESDFNITEFYQINCTFLEDNSCNFIRNHYLSSIKRK